MRAKPFSGGRENPPKQRTDIEAFDQTTECDHVDASQRALPPVLPGARGRNPQMQFRKECLIRKGALVD
jgi:hypothetical protein